MISLVTKATNVDSKLLTIVFIFLSGTDHSVKVSSNSESVRAGALLEIFGGYRELMLSIEANRVDPEQTAPLISGWTQNRSSLIWVHTVCHRGFLNISADEKSKRLLLRLAH